MAGNTTNVTIRMDADLKAQAEGPRPKSCSRNWG